MWFASYTVLPVIGIIMGDRVFIQFKHIRKGCMPKKEKIWTMEECQKVRSGPWAWSVWIKGSRKPIRVVAFDLQHIKNQLEGKAVIRAQKEKPEEEGSIWKLQCH